MWIAGLKSNESTVEVLNKTPEWTLSELQTVIPANHGGTASDYSFYQVSESGKARIESGHSYAVTWTANDISGISFALEDAKEYLKFSTSDPTTIDADGVDVCNITIERWDSSLSAKTSFTGDLVLPIYAPGGGVKSKFSFVDGTCNKAFTTTKSGRWLFPLPGALEDIRLDGNFITIDALEVI